MRAARGLLHPWLFTKTVSERSFPRDADIWSSEIRRRRKDGERVAFESVLVKSKRVEAVFHGWS